MLANGLTKVMEELEISARVQLGLSQFSDVLIFIHRHYECVHEFAHVHSSGQKVPLMMWGRYILSINDRMMAAWESKSRETIEMRNRRRAVITRITIAGLV